MFDYSCYNVGRDSLVASLLAVADPPDLGFPYSVDCDVVERLRAGKTCFAHIPNGVDPGARRPSYPTAKTAI